jgi:hypothetical protein
MYYPHHSPGKNKENHEKSQLGQLVPRQDSNQIFPKCKISHTAVLHLNTIKIIYFIWLKDKKLIVSSPIGIMNDIHALEIHTILRCILYFMAQIHYSDIKRKKVRKIIVYYTITELWKQLGHRYI